MIELQGKYNSARVFTDNIEPEAAAQIIRLLNQEFAKGSRVRFMPDCHAGAGCTVGTTMTVTDRVVPNLVGADIGCGMQTVLLKDTSVDLARLDRVIREQVPAGYCVRSSVHPLARELDPAELRCVSRVDLNRAGLSMGTLGGGNHFIELDRDTDGRHYLVVHSGSRYLGKQVSEYYQKQAARELEHRRRDISGLVARLRAEGRKEELGSALEEYDLLKVDRSLACASGPLMEDYLHDMEVTRRFADLNRRAIVCEILRHMKWEQADSFTTVHNYIDPRTKVLRKGAVSAKKGERVLIPINMRDGSLLCTGLGNEDWNESAPHGAGRLMSRSAAKQRITLRQYSEAMKDVYTTSVNASTIDESPFAYKPMEEILANIADTVKVDKVIRPVYNFKAGSKTETHS